MKKKAGIVILAILFAALICGSFYFVKIKLFFTLILDVSYDSMLL